MNTYNRYCCNITAGCVNKQLFANNLSIKCYVSGYTAAARQTLWDHKCSQNQGLSFNAKHLTFTWKKVIYILELQTIKIHNEQNHFTMNIIFPCINQERSVTLSTVLVRKKTVKSTPNFVSIFTVWYTVKNVIYMQ